MDIIIEIGIIIIIATLGAYIARLFKQPLIPAYIIAGAVLGPILGLITSGTLIEQLSEIGIAFLLFIVGLELDFKKIKDIGLISSVGGVIQTFLCFIFGFFIANVFGFNRTEAIYIGLIVAFSSTLIVIKLLSDKKELNTLHGRIIIGILLIQDIIAIFAISALTTDKSLTIASSLFSLLKGAFLVGVAIFLSKYVFPSVFKFAAKTQELLFLLSISICFLFAFLFYFIGYSIIIGAFIAGVALGNLPYNLEIIGKVKSLRDFFAILFFSTLGLKLVFDNLSIMVLPIIVFTIIIILLKPLIIMFISGFFGYSKRTSFLTGVNLGQISEFSLIIVAAGAILGHVSNGILSMTTILAITTMTITSYFIKFDQFLYRFCSKYLGVFDRLSSKKMEYFPVELDYEIILCGLDRIGYSIMKTLLKKKKKVFVIDFNPDVIKRLVDKKIPCMYGDVTDTEILDRINFKKVKIVISTVANFEDNKFLMKYVKNENPRAVIFVTANKLDEAMSLYKREADYVILPHFLGGEKASNLLEENINKITELHKTRLQHLEELKERAEIGHEHPAHTH